MLERHQRVTGSDYARDRFQSPLSRCSWSLRPPEGFTAVDQPQHYDMQLTKRTIGTEMKSIMLGDMTTLNRYRDEANDGDFGLRSTQSV